MGYDYPLFGWCISSRDGSAVRVDHPAGKLLFLDSKGKEIREVDLFRDDKWDIEKGIPAFAFPENGEYFVVNANRGVPVAIGAYSEEHSGVSGNPHLILFTDDGIEIWRYELPVSSGNGVAISSKGERIIGTGTTFHIEKGTVDACTWLVGRAGTIIKKYGFFSRHMRFSPDEKYIVVNYHKPAPTRTILLVDSKSGEILWHYEIEQSFGRVSDVIVSNEGSVVATFANKDVCVFDRSGEIIFKRTLPEKDLVRTGLSSNGVCLGISTQQGVEIMETESEEK